MTPPPEEVRRMPWHERATLALREAVWGVIAEHKRLGLPLAVYRNGQVVWISAEEAEAEYLAAQAAEATSAGTPRPPALRDDGQPEV